MGWIEEHPPVCPKAGMEFCQVRSKDPVLQPGQYLVSHPLIKRHASLQRGTLIYHARTEYNICLVIYQGQHHFIYQFRWILPVAM